MENEDKILQQESSEYANIDNILNILKKRKNIILLVTVILTFIMFFVSVFIISPKYTSNTEILVNRKYEQNNQSNPQAQIQADIQMISTYKDIITSPSVLDSASNQLEKQGFEVDADTIKNSLDITSQQNSQVFTINVKTNNPKLSAAIANTVAKVFKQKVKKIMSVNNVSILSKAQLNETPVSPKILENTLMGLIIGLLLGILLAFVENGLDSTINDMSFITNELKLNELGIISEIPSVQVKKIISQNSSSHLPRKLSRKRV